jgi:hypothetical protein
VERRDFLGMFPLATLAGLQAPATTGRETIATPGSARERFAGMYKLVSFAPHGASPMGRIYYDRAGTMAAMLLPPGRKPLPEMPTVDDFRNTQRGVVAYFGTYDVDEPTGRVIHHLQAGSNPMWIGTDFIRWYEFSGNRLTLKTNPNATNVLVWERLEP